MDVQEVAAKELFWFSTTLHSVYLLVDQNEHYFLNFNNQQDKLLYGAPGSGYWNGKIIRNYITV